jgi:hypothetical protein
MNPTRKLVLLHLIANALLLWLAYEWLGVGDSTGLRLVFSALDALVILALTCWLYGATFVFFRADGGKLNEAFRTALRNLAPLVCAALAAILIYGLLVWGGDSLAAAAAKIKKPLKPATMVSIARALVWLVRWIVLPLALVPMASAIAAGGWRGFGAIGWRLNQWRIPLLLVAGLVLPWLLLGWAPRAGSFNIQLMSFALRSLCAYILCVGSLIVAAAAASHRLAFPKV